MYQNPTVTPILVHEQILQSDHSCYIASFSGKGSLDQVSFHLLVETASPYRETSEKVLSCFQTSIISQENSSLTTALQVAFQTCHQTLRQTNDRMALVERIGVGLICIAVRENQLYIAQAGPGVVYCRDEQGTRKLRLVSVLSDQEENPGNETQMVGIGGEDVQVIMDRQPLQSGQRFIAANSALANATSYDGLDEILKSPVDEATRKLVVTMGEDPYFAALIVTAPLTE